MNQQDFTDAFILWLSGAAKMRNEREIEWEAEIYGTVYIEFPTNTPTYATVKRYWPNTNDLFWCYEYVNGL